MTKFRTQTNVDLEQVFPTTKTSKKPRKYYRKSKHNTTKAETAHERYRRFLEVIGLVIAAFVCVGGSYAVVEASDYAFSPSSNVAAIAKNNLENAKKMAASIEETNKRVDNLLSYMNASFDIASKLQNQLNDLKMASTPERQALVAGIVYRFERVAQQMDEVALDWHRGKIHSYFPELFGYKTDCLNGACSLVGHQAGNCEYDSKT